MRRFILASLAALISVGGMLTSAPAASAAKPKAKVLTIIVYSDWEALGETPAVGAADCYADGSALDEGVGVKLTNEDGRIVGVGSLKWKLFGELIDSGTDYTYRYSYDCALTAKVKVLPAQFYELTLGDVSGGSYVGNSFALRKWILTLTFG